MVTLTNGVGNGNTAEITAENKLEVSSVSRSITQHINENYNKHFSLTFDAIDPVGADDYFVYINNTGTKNIHLTKFRFRSTVPGSVELHHVSGTASYAADVDISPANRYLGAANVVTLVAKTDTNTTGLTKLEDLIHIRLAVADTDYVDDAPSHIIIPPGQAFACLWDTATGILSGTIDFYEDPGV